MLVAELNPMERPREKFLNKGAKALTMEELLAILLRTGYKGTSATDVAREILTSFVGGEYALASLTPKQLMTIKGVGKDKAVTICAAIELGKRLATMKVKQKYADFSSSRAVGEYVMELMRHLLVEEFRIALLNMKNKLIDIVTISTGKINASYTEQRNVFRKAIEGNAAAIILLHNHPSGDPTPSEMDIKVTEKFVEAGKIMGIPVLDHIIIGDGIYTSLNEQGLI